MKTRKEIKERDAVLLAVDALTHALLGQAWDIDAHMVIKRQILDIIEQLDPADIFRVTRTIDNGTQFMGDK